MATPWTPSRRMASAVGRGWASGGSHDAIPSTVAVTTPYPIDRTKDGGQEMSSIKRLNLVVVDHSESVEAAVGDLKVVAGVQAGDGFDQLVARADAPTSDRNAVTDIVHVIVGGTKT